MDRTKKNGSIYIEIKVLSLSILVSLMKLVYLVGNIFKRLVN